MHMCVYLYISICISFMSEEKHILINLHRVSTLTNEYPQQEMNMLAPQKPVSCSPHLLPLPPPMAAIMATSNSIALGCQILSFL